MNLVLFYLYSWKAFKSKDKEQLQMVTNISCNVIVKKFYFEVENGILNFSDSNCISMVNELNTRNHHSYLNRNMKPVLTTALEALKAS